VSVRHISCETFARKPAIIAHARVAAEVEARWANLKKGTQRVSHKEALAIAGEFYRQVVAEWEEDPGPEEKLIGPLLADQVATRSPQVRVIAAGDPEIADRLLARVVDHNRPKVAAFLDREGMRLDDDSMQRVMDAVNGAMAEGRAQVLQFARGDYSPDPRAERFPRRAAPEEKTAPATHRRRTSMTCWTSSTDIPPRRGTRCRQERSGAQ